MPLRSNHAFDILSGEVVSGRIASLTAEEFRVYVLLYMRCHQLNLQMKSDIEYLQRLIGYGTREQIQTVINTAFVPCPMDPSLITHPRLWERMEVCEAKSKAAQAGVEQRLIKNWTGAVKPTKPKEVTVPPELANMELYRRDYRLCSNWESLIQAWKKKFPEIDLMFQLGKAHQWELDNPGKVKSNRPAYLERWFARAQSNAAYSKPPALKLQEKVCLVCKRPMGQLPRATGAKICGWCERKKEADVRSRAAQRPNREPTLLGDIFAD